MGAGGEADKVYEHDGDDLALLGWETWYRAQRCAAFRAEFCPVGIVLAAVRAHRHDDTVRLAAETEWCHSRIQLTVLAN
jgi:hypothetical protein